MKWILRSLFIKDKIGQCLPMTLFVTFFCSTFFLQDSKSWIVSFLLELWKFPSESNSCKKAPVTWSMSIKVPITLDPLNKSFSSVCPSSRGYAAMSSQPPSSTPEHTLVWCWEPLQIKQNTFVPTVASFMPSQLAICRRSTNPEWVRVNPRVELDTIICTLDLWTLNFQ